MTEEQKHTIAEAIAHQLISGQEADKKLTAELIKELCEEYNEVRQRGILSDSKESLG